MSFGQQWGPTSSARTRMIGSPATVLVTRPKEDAKLLTVELEQRGVDVILEPIFDIVPLDVVALDLRDTAGLLFTSVNGVRAFSHISDIRDFKVFAVGDATTTAARVAGFSDVDGASGNVEDLFVLVCEKWPPASGALLHAAGHTISGDLAVRLRSLGYVVQRIALYDAQAADALSTRLCDALRAGRVDYALFFSPRTADTFVSLAASACLRDTSKNVEVICLSDAVADMLAGLSWRHVTVAAKPDQKSLLSALDQRLAHTTP